MRKEKVDIIGSEESWIEGRIDKIGNNEEGVIEEIEELNKKMEKSMSGGREEIEVEILIMIEIREKIGGENEEIRSKEMELGWLEKDREWKIKKEKEGGEVGKVEDKREGLRKDEKKENGNEEENIEIRSGDGIDEKDEKGMKVEREE